MPRRESLISKAKALFPDLIETVTRPVRTVIPERAGERFIAEEDVDYSNIRLKAVDKLYLDFGDHVTGYLTLDFDFSGSHPDAPVWLRIKFAERLSEFFENVSEYSGWISKSWIQEEQIHVDVMPSTYRLERRYAFRYVEIEVLDISSKYELIVSDAVCRSVSSADDEKLISYRSEDERLDKLDKIAVRTLHECMQKVFEDGPKRDRRLWMGDLRLEALANYETYRQNDLVKECLYLFGGDTLSDDRIGASLFIEPEIAVDDVSMFDYSLFFPVVLLDYVKQTKDEEALDDLYEIAVRQVYLAKEQVGEDGVVKDSDKIGWCFVDWNMELNKQASAQGIYLYALKAVMELADMCSDDERKEELTLEYERAVAAARQYFFDMETGVFVSGSVKQISWASQCWMILGGAVSVEEGNAIMDRMKGISDVINMVTPYMYHHYISALIILGRDEEAKETIKDYWGGMEAEGADTFWELYRPGFPDESPYGGTIVNSYCHAWSCAPAYFIRKYGW